MWRPIEIKNIDEFWSAIRRPLQQGQHSFTRARCTISQLDFKKIPNRIKELIKTAFDFQLSYTLMKLYVRIIKPLKICCDCLHNVWSIVLFSLISACIAIDWVKIFIRIYIRLQRLYFGCHLIMIDKGEVEFSPKSKIG